MLGPQRSASGHNGSATAISRPCVRDLIRLAATEPQHLPLVASLSVAGTVSLALWGLIALAAWLLVT